MWQIIINGPGYLDTPYTLPEGPTFLGRGDNNDVILLGDQVSRRHARFERAGAGLLVEDLGSLNGTELNGSPIAGAASVHTGDVLMIGENSLRIRHSEDLDDAEKTDTFEVNGAHVARSGLPDVDVPGEILVAQPAQENPYARYHRKASEYDPAVLASPAEEENVEEFETHFLLTKINEKLTASTSLKQYLEGIVDFVVDVAQARMGMALVVDERGKLVPLVFRHAEGLPSGDLPISESSLLEVARKRLTVAFTKSKGDHRSPGREGTRPHDADEVICAPMVQGDTLAGVISLTRAPTLSSMPLPRLVDVLSAIAQMAASGVESWRNREKAQAAALVRRELERFHAPPIVERILGTSRSAGGKPQASLDLKDVTVMFGNIVGLASLPQKLSTEQVIDLLDECYARLTRIIFSFDGTIDKLIGGPVLAVFGAPYTRPDDATRAVRCALSCRRELMGIVSKRPRADQCNIQIGLATGKVLAGMLGTHDRIEHACLGEAVDIASRLQDLASPGQVLSTDKTLAAVGTRFGVHPLGERVLKGLEGKVNILEILEENSSLSTSPGELT